MEIYPVVFDGAVIGELHGIGRLSPDSPTLSLLVIENVSVLGAPRSSDMRPEAATIILDALWGEALVVRSREDFAKLQRVPGFLPEDRYFQMTNSPRFS
ncbi:MAG TPA: hypothetical protein VMS01_04305 [Stellaceae bacterium]|nr:hypothetical protein [Stellaceae bacterium]